MARPSAPPPVKLFVATLQIENAPLDEAIREMATLWGELDFISEDFPFEVTDYYEKEMGQNLRRRFLSFRELVSPDILADVKLQTNRIEEKHSSGAGRVLNLDPGYIDYYKVVLASAKYGGQKVYLKDGIYADMTLVMYRGKWDSFAWGFPDFKSGAYDTVLSRIRDLYKQQVKPST
jgi:hypothetical protein